MASMRVTVLILICAALAFAQTASINPQSVFGTANYIQGGSPKWSTGFGIIEPINTATGTASFTLVNVTPIVVRNAKGQVSNILLQTTTQTGAYQWLTSIRKGKSFETSVGVCAAAGAALSGQNANGAATICGAVDTALSKHVSLFLPIRGQYVSGFGNGGWSIVPTVGFRYQFAAR